MSACASAKPAIFVSRRIFPEVIDKLSAQLDVSSNQADDALPPDALIARLQGKQGAFTTGGDRIDARLLAACPELRICANMAVGYNNFDVPAMTAAGVLATNAPDVLTETTADGGFALLMAAARRVTEGEHYLRAGRWQRWSYDLLAGQDVHGATLGILGMGRIGQAIARRGALGFGMKVLYHNRTRLPAAEEAAVRAEYVAKDELLRRADHVMLVLPLTPDTRHYVGAAELALMKPTATLVNVGRGGVVDDAALAQALRAGRIAAAGLDVFEDEPQVHPDLLACTNVALTPHIASATVPTRLAMAHLAADNLIGYLLGGKALTPINPQVMAGRSSATRS